MSLEDIKQYRKINDPDFLHRIVLKGMQKRFTGSLNPEIKKRINHELNTIKEKNLCGIFVVLEGIFRYFREHEILAALTGNENGSLVAYCLGLTEADPLNYGLYFELFLNPLQPKTPNIVIEVSEKEILKEVKNEKGYRIVNISLPDAALKTIKTVDSDQESNDCLAEIKAKLNDLFNFLAANVTELIEFTHFEFEPVALISKTLKNIANFRSQKVTLAEIPLNDPLTYTLFKDRDIEGIPWLECSDRKMEMAHFGIRNLNDLITYLGSLKIHWHPGSVSAPGIFEDIWELIYLKDNPDTVRYLHPSHRDILKESHGCIIFKEDIVSIITQTAGLSLPEACLLTKALTSKDAETIYNEKKTFIKKAVARGYGPKEAAEVYEAITVAAGQVSDKAATIVEALYVYRLLYLQANYRPEFNTALLNLTRGDSVNDDPAGE